MEIIKFDTLGLDPKILRAITEMGFEEPSPIQAKAIPEVMAGHDVIGQAQTGTGKTAAFGIPLLEMLDPKVKATSALVMCPTRELAVQVAQEIKKLAKYKKGIAVLAVYGGEQIQKQINALKHPVHVIISTPGRIMDHLDRRTINLSKIQMVVLDEADEMLNMGFREDMEAILQHAPDERQTVLFSATMPKPILEITKRFQTNPKLVKVTKQELTVSSIEQIYYDIPSSQKADVITQLVELHNLKLMLVFCNTKRKTDEVTEQFQQLGYKAEAIHGDLRQNQRNNVLARFKKGDVNMLVATDVAARGIDVENVDAVFNFDLPLDEENYVHRIGRTGRAGRSGKAFSFVSGRNDMAKIREIEDYSKVRIERHQLPSGKERIELAKIKLAARLKVLIEEGDMEQYDNMFATFKQEGLTLHQLAAALLKMHFAPMLQQSQNKSNSKSSSREERFGREERSGRGNRDSGGGKGKRGKHSGEADMIRLFLSVGKKDKVSKGDIVGAVSGLSNMSSSNIGVIDIYDKFSFVEVNGEFLNDVLSNVNGNKIKGRKVNVEIAKD